jgi:L-threonylcarbamoyladenylate synthase
VRVLRVPEEVLSDDAVAEAAAVLQRGSLLIYPTDTLYALGGRALDPEAVARVRRAKAREAGKPLPLVAADAEQVRSLCASWPGAAQRLAERFWPGPLTLALPAAGIVPAEVIAGGPTVAVRVPGRSLTRALCAAAGPLVSTSANLAGETPPVTCADAVAGVGEAAALALDAGPGQPLGSTIVDLSGAMPRLVRAGPIAWEDVLTILLSAPPG